MLGPCGFEPGAQRPQMPGEYANHGDQQIKWQHIIMLARVLVLGVAPDRPRHFLAGTSLAEGQPALRGPIGLSVSGRGPAARAAHRQLLPP